VLANDEAAREAHRRLTTRLSADAPAWAVLSMDGLLLAAEGARPLERVGDEGQSVLADWSRQVRRLEAELSAAEAQRHAALAEVQTARDSLDDTEANERGARRAFGEIEAHLVELQRAESAARAEVQELQAAHERAMRMASQHSEERLRATGRAERTREELVSARRERDALADQLRQLDEQVSAIGERVGQGRAEMIALEATSGRREAERAAREALYARIESEMASNAVAREATSARLASLRGQEAEIAERESQLTRELDAMQAELTPVERELASAEARRVELIAERHAAEQRLGVLRAAERAAHEIREARHVAAQRATDEVERLNTEIAETAEMEAETYGGAAWAEQLRLRFDGSAEPLEAFDLEAARRRIAILQRELRAVGGVAESVVEEYRELSERHAFLEHQSADLRVAMAELESALISERVKAGMAAAKVRGKRFGRPSTSAHVVARVEAFAGTTTMSIRQIHQALGGRVSRSVVGEIVKRVRHPS